MSTKRKAPAESLSALSRRTGITRPTLRSWAAEGVDLSDPKQLAARIEVMKRKAQPGSLSEAKLRKVLLECERLEFQLERERGEWCRMSEARAVLDLLDNVVCLLWKTTPRELPNVLDGLPTSRMEKAIAAFVDEQLIPRFAAQIAAGLRRLSENATN